MASTRPTQIQDQYLNRLRKEKIPLTAYLMNGVPIKGRVLAFDSFVVLFDVDGKQQMVFKHAISTIQPTRPVELNFEAESAPAND